MDDLTKQKVKQFLTSAGVSEDAAIEVVEAGDALVAQLPPPVREATHGLLDVLGYIVGRMAATGASEESIHRVVKAILAMRSR